MNRRSSDAAFVEVQSLRKQYRQGSPANHDITFSAGLGEVIAILGPNGAGKTTLALQLLGLLRPTSGSITVGGIDVIAEPAAVKQIATYQPQGGMAMTGLEVRRALAFTSRLRGLSWADARAQANQLAEEFDLMDVFNSTIRNLSGGMQRLVEVAIAFTGSPRLIVLDEPTNDLDPKHRQLVWRRLHRLQQTRTATCLVATHNLLEAEKAVDRVIIVRDGTIVASGSPGELKKSISSRLRLDLFIQPDRELPSSLPGLTEAQELRPGHFRHFLTEAAASRILPYLLAPEAESWLDDFQLAPPSLEDVYFGLEATDYETLAPA